jgi:hypothetical protein
MTDHPSPERVKRRALTRSQVAELTLRQMGNCAACGSRLDFAKKGQVVDEHIVPIFSTPEGLDPNRTENRAFYCKPCATEKTSAEAPDRAKVRRIEQGKTQADKRRERKAREAEAPSRKMGMKPWRPEGYVSPLNSAHPNYRSRGFGK